MKELRLGTNLTLPLEWMTLATVVYGARGSGKTSLGRVLAEETYRAGQRFCAIDLKGDWWGLKSTADGKGEGIPVVVFGGDHQDVPLEENAGAELARIVAELPQSTILDFEHLSKGKQLRFQAQFFAALYDANRDPLVLLMDEAQRYAPQKTFDPESAKCLGAVEDLVKLGRKHGIAPVLFTQRGSSLNKEVSELCDLLVAFRTPGPLDQKRVEDWLDANATKAERLVALNQIASLETGTAIFASGHPDLKLFGVHNVRRPRSFDSSATPKIGERRVEPKQLAKPDLQALRGKMSAAIDRAKADDPKALRARIAELEKAAKVAHRDVKPEKVEVEVVRFDARAAAEAHARVGKLFDDAYQSVLAASGDVQSARTEANRVLGAYRASAEAHAKLSNPASRAASRALAPRVVMPRASDERSRVRAGSSLQPAQRALLAAVAQFPEGISLKRASVVAGYGANTSTMRNGASALRTAGLIEGSNELMRASDAGVSELGGVEPLPTGAELVDYWVAKLQPAVGRLLRVIVAAYPEAVDLETAAAEAEIDPSVSTVRNGLSRIRTLGLIHGKNTAMTADDRLV